MLEECRGRGLKLIRQAEKARKILELIPQQEEGLQAQFGKRLPRDIGRHERMAVAIAADPGAEPNAGQAGRIGDQGRIVTGGAPCLAEPLVEER